MRPDTILKVTDIWLNCNTDTQMALIKKFLDRLDNGISEEWVDYLIDELILGNDLSY